MWKRAMRAMDVGVEAAASPQCMVPLQARLELVNAIGQLNVSIRQTGMCAAICLCTESCCMQLAKEAHASGRLAHFAMPHAIPSLRSLLHAFWYSVNVHLTCFVDVLSFRLTSARHELSAM